MALMAPRLRPLIEKGMNFGIRVAFDSGKCTGPDCAMDWHDYGDLTLLEIDGIQFTDVHGTSISGCKKNVAFS